VRLPWKRKKKNATVIEGPLPDEDALDLVRRGVLKPHEAPLAVLRDLARKQGSAE